ncbi:MAG: hypothetical protein HZB66_01555 [Candidatus Aenigmarchaeota archaeon]|nr:hypothetical protein [Candidatus Aenigmarchaeota archaeon]
MKKFSAFEKGWISAIIDGEGHISLRPHSDGKTYKPSITIANNSEKLIQALKKTIPSGRVYIDERKNKKNWSKTYQFSVWKQNEIKQLLEQIKKHLIIKKGRAELMLEFLRIRKDFVAKRDKNGRFCKINQNPEEYIIYKKFRYL